MLLPINVKFERIIQQSFGDLLLPKGYQRAENQFYLTSEGVGKLIAISRNDEHSYDGHIAIFTIKVHVLSDDFWAFNHPDKPHPAFPFPPYPTWDYYLISRHLGYFYGKKWGDLYLAVDMLTPDEGMVTYLRTLLTTSILPYLDRINSVDDVLAEHSRRTLHGRSKPSGIRMRMLAWLGRRDEAYSELKRLIASRHQRRFRTNLIETAQKFNII